MISLSMVITHNGLCTKHMFYKYGHISGPKSSPDMILIAFHVKFHERKNGIHPGACRPPPNKSPTNKTNPADNGNPAGPSARAVGPAGGSFSEKLPAKYMYGVHAGISWGERERREGKGARERRATRGRRGEYSNIPHRLHVRSYTFIYSHIPSYTFKYFHIPHIPPNIQYQEYEGQHETLKLSYLGSQAVSQNEYSTQCFLVCLQRAWKHPKGVTNN